MPAPTLAYSDFWPDYLRAHKRPLTRALHVIGTIGGLVLLGAGSAIADWRLIATAPVVGYTFAWFSHLAVERNTPETFKHPWFSLISDFRMVAFMLTGRLGRELEKHGID
jgi:hypothetical protein